MSVFNRGTNIIIQADPSFSVKEATDAADRAEAAASGISAPYATRTDFLAANVPPVVTRSSFFVNGNTYAVVRDATGPIVQTNGQTWRPDGVATPFHFGAVGDGVFDDRPAFASMDAAGGPNYIPNPPIAWFVSSPITIKSSCRFDTRMTQKVLSDSDKIKYEPDFFASNEDATVAAVYESDIERIPGRLFVGPAATNAKGSRFVDADGDQGVPVASTLTGAGYGIRDAAILGVSDRGLIAVSGYASNENQPANMPPPNEAMVWPPVTIGVAGFVEQHKVGGAAWSGYFDGVLEDDGFLAVEIAHKNRASNVSMNPYAATGGGAPGIWLAGGGDPSYGGASTFPNSAGIVFLQNGNSWNSGIIFREDSLTGVTGVASEAARADAVQMARGHTLAWFEPTTNTKSFSITSAINSSAGAWAMEAGSRSLDLRMPTGVIFAQLRDGGVGATDFPVMQNGNSTVSFRAEGASTNVDLFLVPKGTGRIRFGAYITQADAPVIGHIEIKDAAGIVRKLAVVA